MVRVEFKQHMNRNESHVIESYNSMKKEKYFWIETH